ncbi:alpha/beta-hydrolase [Hesseltinella vesiculosa]|uniref:Alpha/beta-hydrolase n=1 Tax=Hesseltinella vesiculosa TaxID=101127 RepID=A0A1X2GIC0_9FUNG|nr:alpha/beta-hydrolase [Hesseltinella vesiculosa]
MTINKSDPSTFNHEYATVNGIRTHYVDENSSAAKALLLLHGWPDLWLGWREQIPFLVSMGYRVIVPSLRGFGETDQPSNPDEYGFGTVSKDLVSLLDHLQLPTVAVLAHDWGGAVAWRFAQFYPDRPALPVYVPLEAVVEKLPNFSYQLYLRSPPAEKEINENARAFYTRVFRPVSAARDALIDKTTGTLVAGRPVLPKADILPQKVLDYYVTMLEKYGARGGLNWYKQTKNNYEQCKDLVDKGVTQPVLMVAASDDRALPPSMTEGMEHWIPNLSKHVVDGAGHWILWEKPDECNQLLQDWLSKTYPAIGSPRL